MSTSRRLVAVAVAFLAGRAARADTVDVSATTFLDVGQQTRGGAPGTKPDLVTAAPAFEIITVAARDVRNPVADDLQLVVTSWGSWDLADRRWDNGTTSHLTGDLVTGSLSGRLLARHLTIRVGREHVMTGVARMIQLDGGEAIVSLPFGVRLSGYAGVPVSQRFASRRGLVSWNPVGGDLAYGGRASWSLAIPGVAGRGLDVGASANWVEDHGDPVRQEVGADIRFRPVADVTIAGLESYSVYDERTSEASVRADWTPTRKVQVEADWRYLAPDLFLSRSSILSVFSAETRNEVGGGATVRLAKAVSAGASYHLELEPGRKEGDARYKGHDADASVEWERGHTLAGAEVLYLNALDNGYWAARAFGRQELGRCFAALDVIAHRFRAEVNGEKNAVTGTLSAGVDLARGFSAVVAGRAGVTPFFEQTFGVMAKLVYNQTYRTTEVR